MERLWRSQEGINNAIAIRSSYPDLFKALAELDAAGHSLLSRLSDVPISDIDRLVGVALLRRAVTLFVGSRHLMENSAIEPTKLPIRALFETMLSVRYIVHGGRRKVDLFTPSSRHRRESRARYYYVAAERRRVYARQGMLDGRWGRTRMSRSERQHLRDEIRTEIDRLRTRFPTQWQAFGPLRCYGSRKLYFDSKPWYAFGFPSGKITSIRALAVRFGWKRDYELFYAAFSSVMHPTGIHHDVNMTNQGAEVLHPYTSVAFEVLIFVLTSWQLLILAWITKAYSPESLPHIQAVQEKLAAWTANLHPDIPGGLL